MSKRIDDASLLKIAYEVQSMAELLSKLSFAKGGSQSRMKRKLLSLGCKAAWLLNPTISPSSGVLARNDIELKMQQNAEGTYRKKFTAKIFDKKTGQSCIVGSFDSFEKDRVAISSANPKRHKRRSKEEGSVSVKC